MTYSLGATGLRADLPSTLSNVTLSDDQARAGGQIQAMRNGTAFLCEMPDGSQRLCVIDSSRWTPDGPIYLLPV